jgi:hypothetical protein
LPFFSFSSVFLSVYYAKTKNFMCPIANTNQTYHARHHGNHFFRFLGKSLTKEEKNMQKS